MKLQINWNTFQEEPPGPGLLEFHFPPSSTNSFQFGYLTGSLFLVFQLASICLDHTESGLQCCEMFPWEESLKKGKERHFIKKEKIGHVDNILEK